MSSQNNMGFIIHFYIIFGTNLLTQSPVPVCCFMPISVFRGKGISNGVETEWNQLEKLFWKETYRIDLDPTSEDEGGAHEGRGVPPLPCVHPFGPPTYSFHPYIPTYPKNSRMENRSGVPPPEASVATESQSRPIPAPCRRGNLSPVAIFIISVLSMTRRESFSLGAEGMYQ